MRELVLYSLENTDFSSFTILELGCGPGRFLPFLSCRFKRVIGVDVSPQMLQKAAERCSNLANVELVQTNGLDLNSLRDCSVNILFAYDVFVHLPRGLVKRYLSEAYRVLGEGGHLRFAVATKEILLRSLFPGKGRRRNLRHAIGAVLQCLLPGELTYWKGSFDTGSVASTGELVRQLGKLGFVDIGVYDAGAVPYWVWICCTKPA